ncbi:MAG: hypothetical protein ACT4NY_31215 [Pseudonocardiales bacterium]
MGRAVLVSFGVPMCAVVDRARPAPPTRGADPRLEPIKAAVPAPLDPLYGAQPASSQQNKNGE